MYVLYYEPTHSTAHVLLGPKCYHFISTSSLFAIIKDKYWDSKVSVCTNKQTIHLSGHMKPSKKNVSTVPIIAIATLHFVILFMKAANLLKSQKFITGF